MKGMRIVLYLIALSLAGYFVLSAFRALDIGAITKVLSSPPQVMAILLAACLYASIIPVTGWAWRQLLAGQSERWTVRDLTIILGLTQLAKYVPGNMAQHAARATLALRAGMDARAYFSTLAQETLLAVAASLIVGLALLAWSGHRIAQFPPSASIALYSAAAVLGIIIVVLASTRLGPVELRRRGGWVRRALALAGGLPGPSITLFALAAYVSNYLIIGIGLWLISTCYGAQLSFALVTAAFSLAWVLGFLAPGAPAGLGAREGIMLLLLHGTASPDHLTIFVLLARVVTILGDMLCFSVASLLKARQTSIGRP